MEAKQTKMRALLSLAYPLASRAGRKGVWLISSMRVFAPKAVADPLQKAQRLLERLFPENS